MRVCRMKGNYQGNNNNLYLQKTGCNHHSIRSYLHTNRGDHSGIPLPVQLPAGQAETGLAGKVAAGLPGSLGAGSVKSGFG